MRISRPTMRSFFHPASPSPQLPQQEKDEGVGFRASVMTHGPHSGSWLFNAKAWLAQLGKGSGVCYAICTDREWPW